MKQVFDILTDQYHPHTDSPIEEILYREFKKYGYEPVAQYPLRGFFIDLAFPKIKLAIEADGNEFHTKKDQVERDKWREKIITDQGWKVERFTGSFIHNHYEFAVAKILLKYFYYELSDENRKLALGRVISYYTPIAPKLAKSLLESAERGYRWEGIDNIKPLEIKI